MYKIPRKNLSHYENTVTKRRNTISLSIFLKELEFLSVFLINYKYTVEFIFIQSIIENNISY